MIEQDQPDGRKSLSIESRMDRRLAQLVLKSPNAERRKRTVELIATISSPETTGTPSAMTARAREASNSYPLRDRLETPNAPTSDPGEWFVAPHDQDMLPRSKPPFVGRETDQQWLMARLRKGVDVAPITVICGIGGAGKTALIAEVVHHLLDEQVFKDGVAVVLCEGKANTRDVYIGVMTQIATRWQPPSRDEATLAATLRALLEQRDVLIVLDDINPTLNIQAVTQPFRDAAVRVLCTARSWPRDGRAPDALRFLGSLPPDEAVELFARAYGRASCSDLSEVERKAAARICEAVGGHAFAVKLEGAYARIAQRDLTKLAEEVEQNRRQVLTLEDRDRAQMRTLRQVFAQSIGALPSETQQLFAACAAFRTEEFGRRPLLELGESLGLTAPNAAIDELVGRNLVDVAPREGMPPESDIERLRMHPLIFAFAQELFGGWIEKKQSSARRFIADYFAAYVQKVELSALSFDHRNITATIEWAREHHEQKLLIDLCVGMGPFWQECRDTEASLTHLPDATAAATSLAEGTNTRADWIRVADLELLLAQAEHYQGGTESAEGRFQRNLETRRKWFDRAGEAFVLRQLGHLTRDAWRLEESGDYYQQALNAAIELGDKHAEGANLGSLGGIALDSGDLLTAERYLAESGAIAQQLGDREGVGAVLFRMGLVALMRRNMDDAQDRLERSIPLFRALPNKQREAHSLFQLGRIARDRGDMDDALNKLREALRLADEVRDKRLKGLIISQIAETELARGQVQVALAFLNESLQINREMGNVRTEGADRSQLGRIQYLRGDLDRSEQHFKEALDIARNIARNKVGSRRNEIIDYCELGRIALARGNTAEAESWCDLAISPRPDSKPTEDWQLEGMIASLRGAIAETRHDFGPARENYTASLKYFTRESVSDRRGESEALLALGRLTRVQGGPAGKARKLLEQALGITQRLSYRVAKGLILEELARLDEVEGNLDSAETRYRESLQIDADVENHLALASVRFELGRFLVKTHRDPKQGCGLMDQTISFYQEMHLPALAAAQAARQQLCGE